MYDNYGSEIGTLIGGLLGFSLVMVAVLFVFVVLMIIGQWKAFKKAGYNGWEVLIGGHNQFVNCTFAGVNPIWVLFLIFGSVLFVIPVLGWLAYIILIIYYQVTLGINTAKVFGKGVGFGIALAIPISAPIAWFILGGDNVQYIGKKMDNEPVIGNQNIEPIQPQNSVTQDFSQPAQLTSCKNCGNPLAPNAKFCTHCGTKI